MRIQCALIFLLFKGLIHAQENKSNSNKNNSNKFNEESMAVKTARLFTSDQFHLNEQEFYWRK